MTDCGAQFERAVVRAFNNYFEGPVNGEARRIKQSKWQGQIVDVVVDSPMSDLYMAIECKSTKTEHGAAIYFSQFRNNQVNDISNWLRRTGRNGYLAVEFRQGVGKPRRAFIVPWNHIKALNESDGEKGVGMNLCEESPAIKELGRDGGKYFVEPLTFNKLSMETL